jgi:hypothetical protein
VIKICLGLRPMHPHKVHTNNHATQGTKCQYQGEISLGFRKTLVRQTISGALEALAG